MGWCHEFGPQITPGCGVPMEAGSDACSCVACGVTCTGRFVGCKAVWAAGPKTVSIRREFHDTGTREPAAQAHGVTRLESPLRPRSTDSGDGAGADRLDSPGRTAREMQPVAGRERVAPREQNGPDRAPASTDRALPGGVVPRELRYFLHTLSRHLERVQSLVRQLGEAQEGLDSRLSLVAAHDDDRFDEAASFATELMVIKTELTVIKAELSNLRTALGETQDASGWLAPGETLAQLGETAARSR